MRTILARIVGVMYSFVYVFYGGMQTGEAVVNGPVGKVMSFLCFDENTKIRTFKGVKSMKDVEIGDRLSDNLALVTSVYKMDGTGIQMYDLSGVLVTGSHKVKYKGRYIRVDKHPQAKKVTATSKNLVCLNTTSHKISIMNHEFLDFVESDDCTFTDFKNTYVQMIYNSKQIVPSLRQRTGLMHDTIISMKDNFVLPIQEVSVGDILDNGDVVRGICKHVVIDHMYVEIGKGVLSMPGTWLYKNNSIVRADVVGHPQKSVESGVLFAYQLITENSMYPVISIDNQRIMVIDELETTEPFYHAMKDTIITSGRFRSKLIVV